MTTTQHRFSSIVYDPIPQSRWPRGYFVDGLKLGFCDDCGFHHVYPYPDDAVLKAFYSQYEMPTAQANLAETARLLAQNASPASTIVDIGCGDGSFLKEMHALGFGNLVGFDTSPGIERAKQLGFGRFFNASVGEFLARAEETGRSEGDAVVMINVLEHVTEPLALLRRLHRALPDDGVLCITVPNDFSPLQRAFLKAKGHEPWFVWLPDHLNYFSFETLSTALKASGFEVVDQSALYPMELFLLQDLDYIADPALGPVAHARRVAFEDNMKAAGMTDTLDHFYRTLAAGGYGRDIMVVARKAGGAA
jgi:SAM-dependent methyltransferase